MSLTVIRDYVRDAVGVGINGASYVIKRLVDDVTIASGSTASDSDPNTALAGMFDDDETTIAYPGPIKYTVTDATSGAVRVHTSKSLGLIGAIRAADITRFWRIAGDGVSPGLGSELAVSASGASMNLAIAAGQYIAVMGDHALVYSYPASQALTVTTADATNPRIDTVVLRFYPPGVEQEGRVILALLAGTPAGSPVALALTQNTATYWEVALANIQVDAGVTTIASNKVTDRRTWSLLYPAGITAGDIFYVDANGKLARLAKGTANMVLQQGATIPAWAATLAGLTLSAPTIADFTNAAHDHGDADDGGTLVAAALPVMVGDSGAGGTKGAVPAPAAGDAAALKFLRADATWVAPTAGYTPGGTDVAVADGGTGASDAATARTNLGMVAGAAGDVWVEKAGDTMTGTLGIQVNANPAFTVVQGGGNNVLFVRTDVPLVSLSNGADFGIFSDNAFAVPVFTVDGATGNVEIAGTLTLTGALSLTTNLDAAEIAGGLVSSTEFDYLNGVTSAIQTQLNAKAATSHTHTEPITREVNDQRDIVASGSATISSTTGATVGLSDTMVLASGITYDIFVWGVAMLSAGASGTVSVALDISGTGVTWTPVYIGVTTEGGERSVMPTARVTGVDGTGQTITVTMLGKRVTANGTIGSASFQGFARPRLTD